MKKIDEIFLTALPVPGLLTGCVAMEQMIEAAQNQRCERLVGSYLTRTRAYGVRNDLIDKGIEAWIDAGSKQTTGVLYVRAKAPCQ